jgi:hypothetical protein
MTIEQSPPEVAPFLETIEKIQSQITDTCSYLAKLKTRLDKTKKAIKAKPSITAQIRLLIGELQATKPTADPPRVSQMTESFDGLLRAFQRKLQDGFPGNLRQACEDARLDFKAMTDGFVVGPFFVIADVTKETASIQYAKVVVIQDVPLSVQSIVTQAADLKASLIDTSVDLSRFRKDIYEAIRVAVARRETRTPVAELRVELPATFREMCFIRNATGSSLAKRPAADEYSLARFIIELKQFMQSDDNLQSSQQCRLEPAVIENTKKPKKSIFVPRDIACGFGEGTYYQAIIMQQK